jgi:hypothetical protein
MNADILHADRVESEAPAAASSDIKSRQRWTAQEKSEYLTLFSGSGLTAAEFCREMGLSDATFYLWRRQQQGQDKPEIARVVLSDDCDDSDDAGDESIKPAHTAATRGSSVYVKMPNGVKAKVSGLDARATLELLTSLARHCSPQCSR